MPLQKILFKPGLNLENTRYTTEGGWYDCEKVRFRQGTPEKIGGWAPISTPVNKFAGYCRSLWSWASLSSIVYVGVGTNLKFYIYQGGYYNDVTPIRAFKSALSGPFAATAGSTTVTVTSAGHGATDGDYVNFLGATALSNQAFTRSTATNFTLTTALVTNTPVILSVSSGGSLPTGLIAGYQYYIQVVSGTTVQFTTTPSPAAAVTTTTAGSGTFALYVNSGLTAAVLNSSFAVSNVTTNTFTITTPVAAGVYDTGTGGTVNASYEINVGYDTPQAITGWGAGSWGSGSWGTGQTGSQQARIWYQNNFGQDLVYGYRGGSMYYWLAYVGATPNSTTITIASPGVLTLSSGSLVLGDAVVLTSTGSLPTGLTIGTVYFATNISGGTFQLATTFANALAGTGINTSGSQSGTHYLAANGILVSSLGGASDVPTYVNSVMISDASRFTIAFGCTPYGGGDLDPMLIRWSDQESVVNWTPQATNQAGFIRLSHGSEIRTAVQTRQEIVVITDASIYSFQYLGPPYVWGTQLLGDNISIAGINTAVIASGVVFWMGVDKFYKYDGRVQTLRCDLRQYIYSDINLTQQQQFFASTNEGFNEVWWFYCSANSSVINKYVVYNYFEDVWYFGTMGRTAWMDSGLLSFPVAATYDNTLVYHEDGVDDNTTGTPVAMDSYITSSEFDIGDGHNFGFVWRLIPDVTFRGSSTANPQVSMTLKPLQNSGSGYNNPESEGGVNYGTVTRTAVVPIEQFTQQVYIRVRGRQMAFKVEGNQLGLQWQLGAPRIDIKPDGRRGN